MTTAYAPPATTPRVLVPISVLRQNDALFTCEHCLGPTRPARRVDDHTGGTRFTCEHCRKLNYQVAPGYSPGY